MRKIDEQKEKRITYLLLRMQKEPMNVHQMADAVNMSPKSVSKYITELRIKKKIHIARYGTNNIGAYTVHYMTGDFPDVVKPSRLLKPKAREPIKKSYKFTPRPDEAASWLFNPIAEI
jgi:predicted transcriptional regulator